MSCMEQSVNKWPWYNFFCNTALPIFFTLQSRQQADIPSLVYRVLLANTKNNHPEQFWNINVYLAVLRNTAPLLRDTGSTIWKYRNNLWDKILSIVTDFHQDVLLSSISWRHLHVISFFFIIWLYFYVFTDIRKMNTRSANNKPFSYKTFFFLEKKYCYAIF